VRTLWKPRTGSPAWSGAKTRHAIVRTLLTADASRAARGAGIGPVNSIGRVARTRSGGRPRFDYFWCWLCDHRSGVLSLEDDLRYLVL
jgi:hypothetical protein